MTLVEDYLTPRGVTDRDVIAARGYREIPTGVRIPLYTIASAAGDGEPYGYEDRLIPPKVVNGKPVKFMRPKGQVQQMSVNPLYWEKPSGDRPLWIVEGTTRADALHQRGVHSVVSLTSCWGWRSGAQGLDPQVDELPLKGRATWLWLDGDVTTNRMVYLAAVRLAARLEARGANVRYGIIPDGKGLDDWLAEGNDVMSLRMLLVDDLPAVEDPAVTEDQFREGTGLPRTSDAALARDWLSRTPHVAHIAGEWWGHVNGRWQRSPNGTAARTALLPYMEEIGERYQEIGDESDSKAAKAFGRKTREILESSAKCANVLSQGLAIPEAAREITDFDRNPWLLNLANGTLDLKTRELRAHDPADMLTGISRTVYDPRATAPEWADFLDTSLPDRRVQVYLQRMLGATLVGMTLSQRVIVLSGRTRAGKGTLIRAIFHVLSEDYSGELRREVIMKQARGSADHQTQLMWLKGRRLVSVNETNEGEEFDAARLKALTGGDEITARGMHQDQTTFKPTHNLIMSTNALPNVDSSDHALWGRLRVIPFRQSFLGREDETLDARLMDEAPGILNWLLDGLTAYLADGGEGEVPDDVMRAKQEWRDTGDSVAGFTVTLLAGSPPKDRRLSRADMRAAYDQWCADNDMQPVSPNSGKFKTGLEAAGFREWQVPARLDKSRPRFWVHEEVWGVPDSEMTGASGTKQTAPEPDFKIIGTGQEPSMTCEEPDEPSNPQVARARPLSLVIGDTLRLIAEGRRRAARESDTRFTQFSQVELGSDPVLIMNSSGSRPVHPQMSGSTGFLPDDAPI